MKTKPAVALAEVLTLDEAAHFLRLNKTQIRSLVLK